MSQIGIYRYKISTLDVGRHTINFLKNGSIAGVATVNILEHCDGYKLLKYLNAKGQYRFFNFTNYYQESIEPKEIGNVNNFFDSILTCQTNEVSAGYKAKKKIELTAEHVTDDELALLVDMYTSPRVYLKIGTGDTDKDWVMVSVTGDNITRRRKLKNSKINITITLPDNYSITMV